MDLEKATEMTIGIKHTGPKKRVNPDFPHARFAIWMCDYCDESLQGHSHLIHSPLDGKSQSYHTQCFLQAVSEETITLLQKENDKCPPAITST